MKLATLTILFVILLGGCATTNPGSGVGIRYYLPKTIVKADLTLLLKGCKNNSEGHAQLNVEPTLKLNVVPGTDGKARNLSGKFLGSARTKRQITVSVHPSGLISGVNSTNQDRTTAIIANAAKIITSAGTFIGFVDSSKHSNDPVYSCKSSIIDKLSTIDKIKEIIIIKREQLADKNHPGSYKEIQEEINALAFEIAKIRSSAPLMLNFSVAIPIHELKPKKANSKLIKVSDKTLDIKFDAVLKNWLDKSTALNKIEDSDFLNKLLKVNWSGEVAATSSAIYSGEDKSKDFKVCKLSIEIPAQTQLKLQITPKGELYSKKLEEFTKSIPAPQLGNPDELCLSVAIAENRTVNMSFNEFGQRTSFTWNSEARAEAVSGALAGIANDVSSTMSTLEGQSELDKQLETINQVNTQIQYNNALLCQQAAAEGATSCPAPDGN